MIPGASGRATLTYVTDVAMRAAFPERRVVGTVRDDSRMGPQVSVRATWAEGSKIDLGGEP